jgi:hypothetical protein
MNALQREDYASLLRIGVEGLSQGIEKSHECYLRAKRARF